MRAPAPGTYKIRKHRTRPGARAVWLPVRIVRSVASDPLTGETLDRSPRPLALVAGRAIDPWRVWESCHPISEIEYQWLRALTAIREMSP